MNQKYQTGYYIPTAYKKAWIMWDLNNGHKSPKGSGKGYIWIFSTRDAARNYRKIQHSDPMNSRLSQPIQINGK